MYVIKYVRNGIYMSDVQEYSFYDDWVQETLWKHIVPSDIHWACSKLEAMKQVQSMCDVGECYFIGDKEANFLLRIVVRNPFVIEPHIMGNGRRMREVITGAYPLVFAKGVKRINLYTQHISIARIMRKMGYSLVAVIPASHLHDGELVDVAVLTYTKEDYERTLADGHS